MNNRKNKFELIVSTFIILFSISISAFLINKYLLTEFTEPNPIQAETKEQMNLSNLDLASKSKTLVLALQSSCHYCTESAPFYKRLIKEVEGKNIKLLAVFPADIKESRKHLNELGLNKLDVQQASLDSIHVDGTPTLILVDDKGEIINYWVGKLPPNVETEVINKLISEG